MCGTVEDFIPGFSCQVVNTLINVLIENEYPLEVESIDAIALFLLHFLPKFIVHVLLMLPIIVILTVVLILIVHIIIKEL